MSDNKKPDEKPVSDAASGLAALGTLGTLIVCIVFFVKMFTTDDKADSQHYMLVGLVAAIACAIVSQGIKVPPKP